MPDQPIDVQPATAKDAGAIAEIYNHFVRRSTATFEEEPVAAAEIKRRMKSVSAASLPWLAAKEGGDVLGYAYASPWRPRAAYRYSVEISAYIAPACQRRGIGSRLYECLMPMLEAGEIHAVIGGIALPNRASIALHEKFGLKKVAHFREVGFKFGRWIDVGYWQRVL